MKKIYTLILFLFVFQSCSFEDYQIDPNRTIEANPSLLLTNLITNSFNNLNFSAPLASRMIVWVDGQDLSQYYNWNRSGYGSYGQLRQTVKMIEEAERTGLSQYIALSKFFQAYHYYQLTMTFGDIPFSEAMSGFDDSFFPAYDRQEDVFAGILRLLEEANQELATAENTEILGDVLFMGDVMKWRKSINSFRLRVLMTLSNKDGSSSIDIRQQFQQIVEDPTTFPIMASNEDNLALQHYDVAGSRYPFFNNQNLKVAYPLETTLVELFKEREDPRLFAIANPNALSGDSNDFDSYGGLDGSASFDELQAEFLSGVGSFANSRYSDEPINEPTVTMSYSELQFILAEGVELGWIGGDAAIFYNRGILANMEFYGISDASSYLTHPLVEYDQSNAIELINTQKYLTYFFAGGWEPFYNQRRTGYPTFSTTDFNDGQIPVRWMYPLSELNLNIENVEAAIQSQFNGNDTINGAMWLIN